MLLHTRGANQRPALVNLLPTVGTQGWWGIGTLIKSPCDELSVPS